MAPDVAGKSGKSATDPPQTLCGRQTLLWSCFGRLATIWPLSHGPNPQTMLLGKRTEP